MNKRKDPSEALASLQSQQRRKQTVKCGLCEQFGHTRKTCKEPINASQTDSASRGPPRAATTNIIKEASMGGTRRKLFVCTYLL